MIILDSLCAVGGISSVGVCEYRALAPWMDEGARAWAERLCPGAQSVFVALFPYFTGRAPGNLSLYARGTDYHAVIARALAPFAARLRQSEGVQAVVLADDSPLPETQAARLAGVGKLGENGLIFDPAYGSFVFIGTILTDRPFAPLPAVHEFDPPTAPPDRSSRVLQCNHCGACHRNCPGGALGPDGTVDQTRCLSALTQQGGELSPEAAALVARHDRIWGCDQCQTICPLNRLIRHSQNSAFCENQIASLCEADVDGLTRRQFAEAYPDRAFTWRGPEPLVRNLNLQKESHS